jgi:D-serine deaminase-like pyridoxal phosphate-dependent protein
MARLDASSLEDIALTVGSALFGHKRQKGWVISDAGWMALSSYLPIEGRRSRK